jgi:hypothetical protein
MQTPHKDVIALCYGAVWASGHGVASGGEPWKLGGAPSVYQVRYCSRRDNIYQLAGKEGSLNRCIALLPLL